MINALGRGGTDLTVIEIVTGRAGVIGGGLALFFKGDGARGDTAGPIRDPGRSTPRRRTTAKAIPMSKILAI
jgi:hypothetical protein